MSSSDLAISVRGVGKSYSIARNQEKRNTLAETVLSRLRKPWERQRTETFWALKDVSVDIQCGEVVGVIGRNGAGKSTLLKVLSRITEPTEGEFDLYGRVGSLLEVATGFHPELTGRENIFLYGAILGMTRAEIRAKFDEIVDFAGTERFLDTPAKRYSSGMYVRLAFAVAAHLNPEILIVDEVLAVGDVAFQKKCLDKMEQIGGIGRTVLFVSHSMPTIARLCKTALVLSNGQVRYMGPVSNAINLYLNDDGQKPAERIWEDRSTAPGDNRTKLRAVRIINSAGVVTHEIPISEATVVEVEYDQLVSDLERPLTVGIQILNDTGIILFASSDFNNQAWYNTARTIGRVRTRCFIPPHLLAEGTYSVLVGICTYNPNATLALERDAVVFQATADPASLTAMEYAGDWPGIVRPSLFWEAGYIE